MDHFITFMGGVLAALALFIFILLPISNKWAHEDNIIVSKDGRILTCHIREDFPKTNCELVAKAIGPYGAEEKTLIIKDK